MSQKLSALVIGVGSIGERHLRCFQATGEFSVAACDFNKDLVTSIGEKYDCAAYTSLDDALAQGRFDLAIVCTLANTHIPIATRCVEAGMHVLIEKPLSLTDEGIAELQALAATRNRVLRVGYTTRAILGLAQLKKLVADGTIGQPKHLSVVTGQNFPSFRPVYRSIYYARHETGGGAIQDALTHQIHTIEWILAPVRKVFASAARQVLDGVDVEDTVNVTAELADGTLASFAFNQFQAPNENTIQINGTAGSIRFERHHNRLGVYRFGDTEWRWTPLAEEGRDDMYIRQAEYFLEDIRGGRSPLSTVDEAWQTMKVNNAALESSRTHREITL